MSQVIRNGTGLETQRAALLRRVARLSLAGFGVLLVAYTIARIVIPTFPWGGLVMVVLLSGAGVAGSLRALHVGRLNLGTTLYFAVMLLSLAATGQWLGGVTGPLSFLYIVIVIGAAMVGGRRAAMTAAMLAALLVMGLGMRGRPDSAMRIVTDLAGLHTLFIVILVMVLAIVTLLLVRWLEVSDRTARALRQQTAALDEATRQVEVAKQEADAAQQREAGVRQQVQEAVQAYIDFLRRVSEGDYIARLGTIGEDETEVGEGLHQLRIHLANTIDNLVAAAQEARIAQRLYIQQSWETFRESSEAPTGFHYRDAVVTPEDDAWLPLMTQAVHTQALTVDEKGEIALPLDIRGELIGALGLRRSDRRHWHEQDVLLLRDISDQLAQTLERLRLLDDVSRRAALEQTIGEVTSRVRAEVEIEAVVERALAELAHALGAEQGSASLMLESSEEREI